MHQKGLNKSIDQGPRPSGREVHTDLPDHLAFEKDSLASKLLL